MKMGLYLLPVICHFYFISWIALLFFFEINLHVIIRIKYCKWFRFSIAWYLRQFFFMSCILSSKFYRRFFTTIKKRQWKFHYCYRPLLNQCSKQVVLNCNPSLLTFAAKYVCISWVTTPVTESSLFVTRSSMQALPTTVVEAVISKSAIITSCNKGTILSYNMNTGWIFLTI